MSALKTKALPKKVSASGTLQVMQRLNEYEFGVELWVMREGVNRNRWDYRNLRQHYLTFLGQPLLVAYVGNQVGDGHNMAKRWDPKTGKEYYSFTDATAERIVGSSHTACPPSIVGSGVGSEPPLLPHAERAKAAAIATSAKAEGLLMRRA